MNEKTEQIVKGAIRTVATLVPGGSVFVQAWSEYEAVRSKQRLDQLMHDFGENLLAQSNLATEERIRSEFPVLLETIIDKIRREPSEAKRKHYAKLLSNSFKPTNEVSLDDKINAIESLEQLNAEDLDLLKSFRSGRKIRVDELVPKSNFYQFPPDLEEHVGKLIVSLQKLEVRGLLAPTTGVNKGFDYIGERTDWVNVWRGKTYVILPFGKRFCALVWE